VKLTLRVLIVFAVPAVVAAGAPQAFAQAADLQRGNGLFGGGPVDPNLRQRLDVTLSSTEASDSDVPAEAAIGVGVPAQPGGYSTILVGAADYSWRGPSVQVRATGTSTLSLFSPLADVVYSFSRSVSHTAGVGVSARLSKHTTLVVNQTVTYSPAYLYSLFPRTAEPALGDAPPAPPNYAIGDSESRSYGTTMTLNHDLARLGSLSATADYEHTDTSGGGAIQSGLVSYGIRGNFSHRLARHTVATADYIQRISEVGFGSGAITWGRYAEQGFEIGVDHELPLSATRSLTFGTRFGSSTMLLPTPAAGVDPTGGHFGRRSAQVTMGYQFGRSWQTHAIYHRGIDYVAGLSAPISADSYTATVAGLLGRRVDVLVSAGYSNGASAVSLNRSTFDTYTGDVRLRYALTRVLATYVEYLYYFYEFRGTTPLAPGLPSGLARTGVRAGLMLRTPALRR
jgi:hypothetical protein